MPANLYRVTVTHYSPKNSHESIEAYLIANNNEEVITWIDANNYGKWSDWDKYPDDYEDASVWVIGANAEKLLASAHEFGLTVEDSDVTGPRSVMLRWWCGDFDEVEDAYYGCTHHAWQNLGLVTDVEVSILTKLGVAIAV